MGEDRVREEKEIEDERREAAIASAPSLKPNFKRSGVTEEQLTKLQVLHKRRLQIKAKSETYKKPKVGKSQCKSFVARTFKDGGSVVRSEKSSSYISKHHIDKDGSSTRLDDKDVNNAPKKRQKLHWGLTPKKDGKGKPTCRYT